MSEPRTIYTIEVIVAAEPADDRATRKALLEDAMASGRYCVVDWEEA